MMLRAPAGSLAPALRWDSDGSGDDDVLDPGPDVTFRRLLAALLGSDLWSVRWVKDPASGLQPFSAGSTLRGVARWRRWMAAVSSRVCAPQGVAQRDEPHSR
jgi:hypothetical protein